MPPKIDRFLNRKFTIVIPDNLGLVATKVAERNGGETATVRVCMSYRRENEIIGDPAAVRAVMGRTAPTDRSSVVGLAICRWLEAGAPEILDSPDPPTKRAPVVVWLTIELVDAYWDAVEKWGHLFDRRGRRAGTAPKAIGYRWAAVILADYLSWTLGRPIAVDEDPDDVEAPERIAAPRDLTEPPPDHRSAVYVPHAGAMREAEEQHRHAVAEQRKFAEANERAQQRWKESQPK